MIELSLCVVTNNNEDTIIKCLEPIKDIVEEIIIVDMGSSDNTKMIAKKYTERIIEFDKNENKANALNLSFSMASKDYIMWLEPDDALDEKACLEITALKDTLDPSVDVVTALHRYLRDEGENGLISLTRNHIIKNSGTYNWEKGLAEYLPAKGKVMNSDIVITNRPTASNSSNFPGIFENLLEIGKKLFSHDIYYYANKLYEHNLYDIAIKYYKEFLENDEGWIGDKLSSCERLADIYNKAQNSEKELYYLLNSFQFDIPRAEFCCKLGDFFMKYDEINKAISWYNAALTLEKSLDNYGFYNDAYWTWLPHVQLSICYHKLGEKQKAYENNEMARKYLPTNETILNNKKLFESLLNMEKPTFKSPAINISKTLKRPLRIVQVAPNVYPIPPENYGGTEVVIYELTEELVRRGYDVYLYALKGSKTNANLIPYNDTIGMDSVEIMKFVTETLPDKVDVFHYHTYPSIISSKCISIPSLCTIHGPIDAVAKNPVYVSNRAKELFGNNRGYYVYNGIDLSRFEFNDKKKDYLLFLGRIDSEKGVHHAIEIAERTNHRLIIAGPIHDFEYYNTKMKSRINNNPNIHYVGPIGGKKKQDLLKHAKCMLFPITWEEPFGLVMTEAMACGTPVIALKCGSVPEVLAGFPELICNNLEDMIKKVLYEKLPSPQELRQYVSNNFSGKIMADRYIEIYEKLIREMS